MSKTQSTNALPAQANTIGRTAEKESARACQALNISHGQGSTGPAPNKINNDMTSGAARSDRRSVLYSIRKTAKAV